MIKKFNKKSLIILIVFILLIVVGGFLWLGKEEKVDIYKYDKSENYILEEGVLKNPSAKVEIEIPEGWEVDIGQIGEEAEVSFLAPGAEFDSDKRLKKGQITWFNIMNCIDRDYIACGNYDVYKGIVDKGTGDEFFEVINVGNLTGLKEKKAKDDNAIYTVEVFHDNKIYQIMTIVVPDNEENYKEFEKLIKGIEFLK